jgi:shikimate kinase
MTNLNTAKINSLMQDVRCHRVDIDNLLDRVEKLEYAENYRQQDEDAERAYEPSVFSHTLVERVALAINKAGGNSIHQARAAILVVAGDLREECAPEAAEWLEELVEHD